MNTEQFELHEIYTVSQLNAEVRVLLEQSFQQIWMMGEISNFTRPSSGHIYFSLKDKAAQVRCAYFRNNQTRIKFKPENGQQVLALGYVSLYEPRGDYQFIVLHLEIAGDGALQIAFEQLKNRLAQEGLFDAQHKKLLPTFPKQIGVITSATGAAIRDILTVLKRRFASIPVIIYPTLVQGEQAASQIANMIKVANLRNECSVIILARGGGSLEDLWSFNEEIVARAIFASDLPIVTGVGHEIDFTIADFVADLRAATPSAAAESITPDQAELKQKLFKLQRLLQKCMLSHLQHEKNHLLHLQKRLRHPGQRIQEQSQRLDAIEQSLILAQKNLMQLKYIKMEHLITQFNASSPRAKIKVMQDKLEVIQQKMQSLILYQLKSSRQLCTHLAATLDAFNPHKTLARGYAIVTNKKTQQIIRHAQDAPVGDEISVQLAEGKLEANVVSNS